MVANLVYKVHADTEEGKTAFKEDLTGWTHKCPKKDSIEGQATYGIEQIRPPTRYARPHVDLEVSKLIFCSGAKRCRRCEFVHPAEER